MRPVLGEACARVGQGTPCARFSDGRPRRELIRRRAQRGHQQPPARKSAAAPDTDSDTRDVVCAAHTRMSEVPAGLRPVTLLKKRSPCSHFRGNLTGPFAAFSVLIMTVCSDPLGDFTSQTRYVPKS